MRIIHFDANEQVLTVNQDDTRNIIRGSLGFYQAFFTLSDDYTGCKVVAKFTSGTATEYVPLVRNACMVPAVVLDRPKYTVELIAQKEGGYRITTSKVTIVQGD